MNEISADVLKSELKIPVILEYANGKSNVFRYIKTEPSTNTVYFGNDFYPERIEFDLDIEEMQDCPLKDMLIKT